MNVYIDANKYIVGDDGQVFYSPTIGEEVVLPNVVVASTDGPRHGQVMKCNVCHLYLRGRNELVKHQRAMHPDEKCGSITCQEPGCVYACFAVKHLCTHLQESHGLKVDKSEHFFDGEDDFIDWKLEYENENECQYRLTSTKRKDHCRYYGCSRTGFYNPKQDVKRQSKRRGTSKINGHCVSTMVVKTDHIGQVGVVFVETHYGHPMEMRHLRLSSTLKALIQVLLDSNFTPDDVVKKINAADHSDVEMAITKKDVLNVVYTLNNNRLDTDYDFNTPRYGWVGGANAALHGNIMYHKAIDNHSSLFPDLSEDVFVLCIMTEQQRLGIETFAENGLCVEVTRGANGDKKLCVITLMGYANNVKDKHKDVDDVPLAWCIANGDNVNIKKCFFQNILKQCPSLTCPFLMTNDLYETHETWVEVFGNTHRIISPWAVQDTINRAVKEKVFGESNRTELQDRLSKIRQTTNAEEFHEQLESFLDDTKNNVTYQEFRKHFLTMFMDEPMEGWAAAHYPMHKEHVDKFADAVSHVQPKLRCCCNKKVGRCTDLIIRHYLTKLHHLDDTFVRRRNRVKKLTKSATLKLCSDLVMKRTHVQEIFHNIITLANEDCTPDNFVEVLDMLKVCKQIVDSLEDHSNILKSSNTNIKKRKRSITTEGKNIKATYKKVKRSNVENYGHPKRLVMANDLHYANNDDLYTITSNRDTVQTEPRLPRVVINQNFNTSTYSNVQANARNQSSPEPLDISHPSSCIVLNEDFLNDDFLMSDDTVFLVHDTVSLNHVTVLNHDHVNLNEDPFLLNEHVVLNADPVVISDNEEPCELDCSYTEHFPPSITLHDTSLTATDATIVLSDVSEPYVIRGQEDLSSRMEVEELQDYTCVGEAGNILCYAPCPAPPAEPLQLHIVAGDFTTDHRCQ